MFDISYYIIINKATRSYSIINYYYCKDIPLVTSVFFFDPSQYLYGYKNWLLYMFRATFVGFVYGLATIVSSTVVVPMVSHALNNLAGGILWYYTSKSKEKSG